ncbi:MAG: tetratricopeptide repeat protein [Vicinamibacterales bacterium]
MTSVSRRLLPLLLACWCVSPVLAAQSADPAARSRAASQAMQEGRFDDAAAIYRELLKAIPDEPGLLMNLGMALAMGGQEGEALAPLERAIALKPDLVPAQLFLGSSLLALGQAEKAISPLKRAVAARPADIEHRQMLAQAYAESGRPADAVTELRRVTASAPKLPGGWYALGHAYNAMTQDAMATFRDEPEESPWRQLLLADALFADGRMTDAFAIYRSTLERLPSMATIHDSIARIYEQTGHKDWAARERSRGTLSATVCAKRKALCEFRAGRHRTALAAAVRESDPESRYWRARAATELALASFKQLEQLPDSRERREVRATLASAERRHVDAIAELEAALKFAPGDPGLLDDLGTAYFLARDYAQAIATLAPLVKANPDNGRLLTVYGDSLLQLQRLDEAIPVLRQAIETSPADPMARLTLGRAYVQKGDFAAAIPLIEPQLAEDHDGSLHVQLSRAYSGVGQREKGAALLERAQQLQRASQERADAAAQRAITPPK